MRFACVLAAAASVWWGLAGPAGAQVAQPDTQKQERQAEPEPAETAKEKDGASGETVEITLDPDLEEEFLVIEALVQIAIQAAEMEGHALDLDDLEKVLLVELAETDRQKAYAYLRIAELHYQRGDKQAAIESLKKGLPLADGDRSKGSLFYRILVSLLTVYSETGQFRESIPYRQIYREIVTAGVDPWERLSGTEDVVHKPTGIRLPHRMGMFTRTQLVVYDETGRDAGANYRVEEGQLPLLSVYVVADFDESAENHFNNSMRPLLARFDGETVLSRGPFSVETGKGTIKGFAGRVNVPADSNGVDLGSDLYVFVRKRTLIKFRVSFRARNREQIEGVMRDIFKGFDWP